MAYAKVCWVKACPEETCIRVAEPSGKYRRDMCKEHGLLTVWFYRSKIVVLDFWNGLTQEEIDNAFKTKPFEDEEDE